MNWMMEAIGPGVNRQTEHDAGRWSVTAGPWKGVCASVLLHAAAITIALLAISPGPPSRQPLVIDFTLEDAGGPETAAASAPARESRRAGVPARPEFPPAVLPLPPPGAPVPGVIPEPRPAPPTAASNTPEVPAPPDRHADAPSPGPTGLPTGVEHAAAVPVPGAVASADSRPGALPGATTSRASTGVGPWSGEPGMSRGRYQERNYGYIRDAIQQGIAYPPMARKMGWAGEVVVAFHLLPDGSVRDVRVVLGSGYPALDRGAVDAVWKAAPFPKPPAEAEIITPVIYRLD